MDRADAGSEDVSRQLGEALRSFPCTGALVRQVFMAPGYAPEAVARVPSFGGSSADEIAVIGFSGALASQARVYDSDTGLQLLRAFYPLP